MGMSTHVVGIRPADADFQKRAEIFARCRELEIDPPSAIADFFDGCEPDPAGVIVAITSSEWTGPDSQGCEVILSDLPEGVKVIRFYNSW